MLSEGHFDSDVDQTLRAISENTREGAATLALRGLDALDILARRLLAQPSLKDEKHVTALTHVICDLRPSIAAIGVQAVIVVAKARVLVADGAGWGAALAETVRDERESMGRAAATIANHATGELGTGRVLATCSWSMTVLKTLLSLEPKRVLIGEGHMLGDGLKSAQWLSARGIEVELYPDAALPSAVGRAAAVIVGADQVLADGSLVNRASTFPLGLAAEHFGVPFYVVCHKIKLSGVAQAVIEEGSRFIADLPAGVEGHLPLFDVTPPSLIRRIITESGIYTTEEAGEIGRGVNALKASVLGP